jgi:hypothetical protein
MPNFDSYSDLEGRKAERMAAPTNAAKSRYLAAAALPKAGLSAER